MRGQSSARSRSEQRSVPGMRVKVGGALLGSHPLDGLRDTRPPLRALLGGRLRKRSGLRRRIGFGAAPRKQGEAQSGGDKRGHPAMRSDVQSDSFQSFKRIPWSGGEGIATAPSMRRIALQPRTGFVQFVVVIINFRIARVGLRHDIAQVLGVQAGDGIAEDGRLIGRGRNHSLDMTIAP